GLEHDIRVAKVTTNFEWPNRLKIVIVERQVAIYIESSYNSFAQLDFNGYVLNVARGIKDASAPYVSGLKVGNVYVGDQVKTPEIQALIGFLGKLEPALLGKISELRCDGQGKVKVIMVSGLCIHLGAIKEMENKAENFITISNEVQSKNINAEYIDLTFTKPYIKVKK
ncbi:MAG: cell division protein FtsQ/DivIB, partial [Acidaminococcaceae bacterium]